MSSDPAPAARPYHVARQPILDRDQELVAYELLFRSGDGRCVPILDPRSATASVILGAFCDLGIVEVLGRSQGYVNIDHATLKADVIEFLPRDRIVLELLESVPIVPPVIERVRELSRSGYRFALDDVTEIARIEAVLPYVSVVKIDVLAVAAPDLPGLVAGLRRASGRALLLAEKVETAEVRRACLDLGFDLFQGFHFARPELVSGRRLEPEKLALLRLLALSQTDCENEELESELRRHPDLVFNLLRVVNSVAVGAVESVGTVRQALIVLGRRQLRRWILLLAFGAPVGGVERPGAAVLRLFAANRAALLERVAARVRPEDREFAERCFFAGLLSLLDALFGTPLGPILHELALAPEIREALLSHHGPIGELLTLVEKVERGDAPVDGSSQAEPGPLTSEALIDAEVAALRWTSELEVAL